MVGKEVQGEFEPECLGPCGAQDTFHVARLNRLGLSANLHRDLCKASFAKLHDCKTPIMAADLDGRVLPFHAENGALPQRVLVDRGTE
jgi:hypothetical protein